MRNSVFLIILLITATLSGCVGSESAVRYSEDGEYAAAPAMMEKGGGLLASYDESAVEPSPVDGTVADRKIIRTGRISIEVGDFDVAHEAVEQLAASADGFVSNSNSYITSDGQKKGTITIRVPAEGFQSVLDEVKKLGEVKSTSSSGQDVTEEYIDLEARLTNYERQEERFLTILENATTVEDVLKVEEQLGRVRGEIERIEGRLRYLDNYVDLSTITVEIAEPQPITRKWGLRDAFSSSVEGFIDSTNALIIFIGNALPWVIFLVLVVGVSKLLRRKKRTKTPE